MPKRHRSLPARVLAAGAALLTALIPVSGPPLDASANANASAPADTAPATTPTGPGDWGDQGNGSISRRYLESYTVAAHRLEL